ncbi:hypothetical protein K457DRAFT_13266 [Linnemannia elongata AG-77]|uniref:Secreted protein n=1 Tax=Linnemannia elongata AG-77 TaxID=1314771 RepID=A0A197KCB8_9FUNG|nr:hypothetical protein K457DRAFT_13266 [Linnemannia elongata AG-77]
MIGYRSFILVYTTYLYLLTTTQYTGPSGAKAGAQGVKPNPLPGVPSTEKSPTSAVLRFMPSRASKNGKTEQT